MDREFVYGGGHAYNQSRESTTGLQTQGSESPLELMGSVGFRCHNNPNLSFAQNFARSRSLTSVFRVSPPDPRAQVPRWNSWGPLAFDVITNTFVSS